MKAGQNVQAREIDRKLFDLRERHGELGDAIGRAMAAVQATATMATATRSPERASSSVCLLLAIAMDMMTQVHAHAQRLGQALDAVNEGA
jgi:hypothetical protein